MTVGEQIQTNHPVSTGRVYALKAAVEWLEIERISGTPDSLMKWQSAILKACDNDWEPLALTLFEDASGLCMGEPRADNEVVWERVSQSLMAHENNPVIIENPRVEGMAHAVDLLCASRDFVDPEDHITRLEGVIARAQRDEWQPLAFLILQEAIDIGSGLDPLNEDIDKRDMENVWYLTRLAAEVAKV